MSNENPTVIEKLTFKPFGPYRFIGKGVVAAPGSGDVFGALWQQEEKTIFETLDGMKAYAVDEEPHAIAMMDSKGIEEHGHNKMWYIIGRFMKPDAPVPQGFDYRDINKIYMGVGHMKGMFLDMIMAQHQLTSEAISAQDEYTFLGVAGGDAFAAEVYLPETNPDSGDSTTMQYYIACELNPEK